MTQDMGGDGAVPPIGTHDDGNGHDRTGLEGAVGAPQYDGGVRATDRTEQRTQEIVPKSADERAKEIGTIDGLLSRLDNPPRPATPETIREQLREAEKGYKTIGIDVEKLRGPEFMKAAYVLLHNVIKNPDKIVKDGRKGLEYFRDHLGSIGKLIKDGLYGKDYTPTNKTPGGLRGQYNTAVIQRLLAENAMGEVERLLRELSAEGQKCQEKLSKTPAIEVDRVQALVNEQTAREYHIAQLEERNIELESKFTEYDDLVMETSKNIKGSEALYQQVLGHKQKIVRLLIKYPRDEEPDRATQALAELVPQLTEAMDNYVTIINQKIGLDNKRDTALAESAMRPIGEPSISVPTGASAYEITQRGREERDDRVTKRREEIRKNPFAGSYLAQTVKQ